MPQLSTINHGSFSFSALPAILHPLNSHLPSRVSIISSHSPWSTSRETGKFSWNKQPARQPGCPPFLLFDKWHMSSFWHHYQLHFHMPCFTWQLLRQLYVLLLSKSFLQFCSHNWTRSENKRSLEEMALNFFHLL